MQALLVIYATGCMATALVLLLRGATCLTWIWVWSLLWPVLWPLTGLACLASWLIWGRSEKE